MKKIFLLSIATTVALSSFAHKAKTCVAGPKSVSNHVAAKTTATGDTATYVHIDFANDTITNYRVAGVDSGYTTGTDAYGDKGFAERYDVTDTLVSVIGVIAEFGGTVNPSTSKTVVFNAWTVGARALDPSYPSGHIYNSGFPNTSIASVTVPLTQLGIGNGAIPDTAKSFWFPTPSTYVPSFFVGYTISYTYAGLAGDTIGLKSNLNGERHYSYYSVSGTDTIINNINATQYDDNTWHDNAFDNFTTRNQLFIFPIVKLGNPNDVNGITKNNFTFYGNYPNPATTATNIKFALAQATEVTVSITDMAGHVISTTKEQYNAGTQVITVNTSAMAAGEYVYLIHTAQGEGFASKMSVIK